MFGFCQSTVIKRGNFNARQFEPSANLELRSEATSKNSDFYFLHNFTL